MPNPRLDQMLLSDISGDRNSMAEVLARGFNDDNVLGCIHKALDELGGAFLCDCAELMSKTVSSLMAASNMELQRKLAQNKKYVQEKGE
ncbi:hypothetical protein MY8738_002973 [Beauveria namnaoensis]